MSDDEYMTSAEVAALLRTTRGAIYTGRNRGEMPGVLGIRFGRRVLYRRADLDAWLQSLHDKQPKLGEEE